MFHRNVLIYEWRNISYYVNNMVDNYCNGWHVLNRGLINFYTNNISKQPKLAEMVSEKNKVVELRKFWRRSEMFWNVLSSEEGAMPSSPVDCQIANFEFIWSDTTCLSANWSLQNYFKQLTTRWLRLILRFNIPESCNM